MKGDLLVERRVLVLILIGLNKFVLLWMGSFSVTEFREYLWLNG